MGEIRYVRTRISKGNIFRFFIRLQMNIKSTWNKPLLKLNVKYCNMKQHSVCVANPRRRDLRSNSCDSPQLRWMIHKKVTYNLISPCWWMSRCILSWAFVFSVPSSACPVWCFQFRQSTSPPHTCSRDSQCPSTSDIDLNCWKTPTIWTHWELHKRIACKVRNADTYTIKTGKHKNVTNAKKMPYWT
jgi:hypothetical protein